MPNYIFLLYDNPAAFENVSAEEIQQIIQQFSEWKQRIRSEGVLLRSEKLQDGTGRVLRLADGKVLVTDGPYTESKEIIGGVFVIQARDYEHAVEIASQCPQLGYGSVEVREVEPVGG
jgi:hypothetical protein